MQEKEPKKRKTFSSCEQPPRETPEPEPEPQDGAPPEEPGQPAAAVQAERDDLLERLQRVSADYLNYQKRVQRDIAQAREFANEELIKALLGVLDDMERAIEVARANHSQDDPFLSGMQLVHDNALRTLEEFGLKTIEAEGKPFDPDKHSAVMQQPSGQHPPQTVLRELRKGYQLKGRVIRPAAVIVSKEPDDEPAPKEQAPPEAEENWQE